MFWLWLGQARGMNVGVVKFAFTPNRKGKSESSWVRARCAHQLPYYSSCNVTVEMERVLKRVGLAKRTQSDAETNMTNNAGDNIKVRRRRRSKSRRHPSKENKKTGGLFNIDWDSVKDCKSCKSRAIARRFCSKKADNELYRSNSFKFERFIRANEEISTLGKKVSTYSHNNITQKHQPYSHRWVLNLQFVNLIMWPSLPYFWGETPFYSKDDRLELPVYR